MHARNATLQNRQAKRVGQALQRSELGRVQHGSDAAECGLMTWALLRRTQLVSRGQKNLARCVSPAMTRPGEIESAKHLGTSCNGSRQSAKSPKGQTEFESGRDQNAGSARVPNPETRECGTHETLGCDRRVRTGQLDRA